MTTSPAGQARLVHYDANEVMPRHAHEHACVTLLLDGSIEERLGAAEAVGHRHQVVVRPADAEHAIRCGRRGASSVQLYLTAEEQQRWRESSRALDRWRCVSGEDLPVAMLRLFATDQRRAAPWTRSEAMAELASALDPLPPRRGGPPRWLLEARQQLLDPATTVQELAAAQGIHPITFTRRFRAAFGTTPITFRRRTRVARAVRALLEGRGPIAGVALDHGFADQAHLTREACALAGWTPAALRNLARTPRGGGA